MADTDEVRAAQDRGRPRRSVSHLMSGDEATQEPLPRDREVGRLRDDSRPTIGELSGDWHERPARGSEPGFGNGWDRQRDTVEHGRLDTPRRRLEVVIDRTLVERNEHEVDAGVAQHVELRRG